MKKENESNTPLEKLDFLSEILVEGQELQVDFLSCNSKNFTVTGSLKIKEQDILLKPKIGVVNSPKAEAWMCTHPKYWKILCGLEPADARTNVKILGMLVHAGLYELSQMMHRRIDVMTSALSAKDLEWLMPQIPPTEENPTKE